MGFDLSGFRSELPKIEKDTVESGVWRLHEAHLLSGTRYSNRLKALADYHELWIKAIKVKHATKKPFSFCLHNYLSTTSHGEPSDCGKIIAAFTGSVETSLKMHYLLQVGRKISEAINSSEIYALISFDIKGRIGSKLKRFEIVTDVKEEHRIPEVMLADKNLRWDSKIKITWTDPFYDPLVISDKKRSGLYVETGVDTDTDVTSSEEDFQPDTEDDETYSEPEETPK